MIRPLKTKIDNYTNRQSYGHTITHTPIGKLSYKKKLILITHKNLGIYQCSSEIPEGRRTRGSGGSG